MTAEGRARDRATATVAALLAAALVGQLVAGKAIRDALFLSAFPPSALPGMMMAASVVSIGAAFVFARVMSRWPPARVMAIGLVASAALYLGEFWLIGTRSGLAAVAVYVHLALFGSALVSGLWSLVNERFDPHAAKALVGRIGAGASLGGVAAGALTWLGAGRVSVPAMLLGLAFVNVAGLVALRYLHCPQGEHEHAPVDEEGLVDARSGLRTLRELAYFRNLALLVALASFTELVVDYVFKVEASAHLSGTRALVAFFGAFYTGLSLLALLVQAVLSKLSLQRLGVSGTVALHPLATGVGAGLALFHPGLGTMLAARGGNGVLRDSLFRSAYELLYTPLPADRKRATKAVIDVGADKLGAVAGALLVLAQVAIKPKEERVLLACVIAACVAAVVVARRLSAGYVSALGESLRVGVVRLDLARAEGSPPQPVTQLVDRATIKAQIEALGGAGGEVAPEGHAPALDSLVDAIVDLRSSRLDRIRTAIRGAYPVDVRLVPFLIPLLGRNDVFPDALRYLRAAAPRCTGHLVDALLDPETPALVRRRIPRVLKGASTTRAVAGLLGALEDPSFDVRYEAAAALSILTSRDPTLVVGADCVFALVVKELDHGEGGEKILDYTFTLLGLVLEREQLRTALQALQTKDQRLRGTALEYLENVLPEHVRQPLWPRIGPAAPRQGSARPRSTVETDLLESMVGVPRSRLRARIAR